MLLSVVRTSFFRSTTSPQPLTNDGARAGGRRRKRPYDLRLLQHQIWLAPSLAASKLRSISLVVVAFDGVHFAASDSLLTL